MTVSASRIHAEKVVLLKCAISKTPRDSKEIHVFASYPTEALTAGLRSSVAKVLRVTRVAWCLEQAPQTVQGRIRVDPTIEETSSD